MIFLKVLRILYADVPVSICVECVCADLAVLAHRSYDLIPCTLNEPCGLGTGFVTHVVVDQRLSGTLILTALEDIEFDSNLIQQGFEIHHLSAEAVPINNTLRIEIDFIGSTGKIIGKGIIAVSVCHQPLSRDLVILQGIVDLFYLSRISTEAAALKIDAGYLVVGLCLLDRREYIFQSLTGVALQFVAQRSGTMI